MSLSRRSSLAAFASLAILAITLTACGGGSDDDARVRLLNAGADPGPVDLISDNDKLSAGVGALAVGEYGNRAAGAATLQLRGANSTANLAATPATLQKGVSHTLIAYGGPEAIRTSLLQEDQTEPASGQSKLMVLNLAPDAGPVSVFVTAPDAVLTSSSPFAASLAVGVGSGYVTQAAGTYRIRVTDPAKRDEIRLDLPAFKLESGQVTTLILRGSTGGTLVHALTLQQRGALTRVDNPSARVRLVVATPSGAIDTTWNGRPLLKGALSPAIGEYQLVDAGTRNLRGTVNGQDLSRDLAPVAAGGDYTVLMRGDSAAPIVDLLTDDNRLPDTTGRARVRVLNGLNRALTLNVNYGVLAGGIAPASYGAGTVSPSASALLTVSSSASTTPLFTEPSFASQSGGLYTVMMLGSEAQPSGVLRRDR